MKYEGHLYGKIGRRYIKLTLTSSDVDNMEGWIRKAEAELEEARRILKQLSFNETMEKAISESRL